MCLCICVGEYVCRLVLLYDPVFWTKLIIILIGRCEKQRGTGNESMPGYTMEKEKLVQIFAEKKAKSSSETGIACGSIRMGN